MTRPFNAVTIIASALALLFFTVLETGTHAEAPLVFHDPLGRFSFAIPPGWHTQLAPPPDVVVQFVDDTLRGTGNVVTEMIRIPMALDEYASVTTAAILRAYPDLQPSALGIEQTTLGGQPARCWQLTDTLSAERLVVTQYAVLIDATAYVLTFVCPEADVESLRNQLSMIVESFTFSDVFPLV